MELPSYDSSCTRTFAPAWAMHKDGCLEMGVPEHSMCEDLLVSCVDNHVVCQVSVDDGGGP
jgi:hypothetical protein